MSVVTELKQTPEQWFRKVFPEVFKRLSKAELADFRELFDLYESTCDPEILETMAELLLPGSAGDVESDPEVDPEAKERLRSFQTSIGKRIKELRLAQEMSQEDLAAKSGLKQSHISRLERGVHTPSDLTIQALAKALNVSPGAIDPGQ